MGRVRAIFRIPDYVANVRDPLVYLELFTPLREVDRDAKMYRVRWQKDSQGKRKASIVSAASIMRSCHLIPRMENDLSGVLSPSLVLDSFDEFFVNDFLDIHSYLNL